MGHSIVFFLVTLFYQFSALAAPKYIGTNSEVSQMYQSQLDNIYLPNSTCGITSLAMAIRFFRDPVTSNEMISWYDYRRAQSNRTMAGILDDFGLHVSVFDSASRSQLEEHIDAGHPIVLQTYFTRAGHILVLVGYDENGWIAHDPNGKWLGSPGTSPYRSGTGAYKKNEQQGPYYGKLVHYNFHEVESSEGVDNYQGIAVHE